MRLCWPGPSELLSFSRSSESARSMPSNSPWNSDILWSRPLIEVVGWGTRIRLVSTNSSLILHTFVVIGFRGLKGGGDVGS